ncbi:TnsA endonuclease N-terminal domain-containing protein [Marinomonas sp. 2405UD66-6]|uniref:TnsA endonuclease N-terminal domain-containing protein n=1 Tax=Marinomonas sp. 2405UD66-6 TaxID=3391834 RepID=UPI0039C92FCC
MSSKNIVVPIGARRGTRLNLNIASQPPIARVREPVRPTAGKVVGFFPSTKMNSQIAWESQLEKRACFLFEFSSCVISYREQPLTIYFPSDGYFRRYTPDFELILSGGERVYVEIKPASKLKNDSLKMKLRDISEFFHKQDCQFIVITDEELNQPTRQSNLALLRPYLSLKFNPELVNAATTFIQQSDCVDISDLSEFTGSLNTAYSLIAQGHIRINLDQLLCLNTLLTVPKEFNDETCLFKYRTAPNFERNPIHS